MDTEVGICKCGGELWYSSKNIIVECVICDYLVSEDLG